MGAARGFLERPDELEAALVDALQVLRGNDLRVSANRIAATLGINARPREVAPARTISGLCFRIKSAI